MQFALAGKYFEISKKQKNLADKGLYEDGVVRWCNTALPNANAIQKEKIDELLKEVKQSATKGNLVDLLKMIDLKKDVISGEWKLQEGKLVSDGSSLARIEIPYEPPEEYDFRLAFARQQGSHDVFQCLSRSGKPFHWQMSAGDDGNLFGFTVLKGDGSDNPSIKKGRLENGKRYASLIQVRKNGIKAYLDNTLLTEWKAEYKELGLNNLLKLRNEKYLGFGSHNSPTIFYSVDVIEISGKGKKAR